MKSLTGLERSGIEASPIPGEFKKVREANPKPVQAAQPVFPYHLPRIEIESEPQEPLIEPRKPGEEMWPCNLQQGGRQMMIHWHHSQQ